MDPVFEERCPDARMLGDTAVRTPLAGPAVLVTAVAPDARLLRGVLDDALSDLLDGPRGVTAEAPSHPFRSYAASQTSSAV